MNKAETRSAPASDTEDVGASEATPLAARGHVPARGMAGVGEAEGVDATGAGSGGLGGRGGVSLGRGRDRGCPTTPSPADLLPAEFIIELSSLQDDVAPLTEAEVVQVMEDELGVPWEDVFASIDPEPLAAGTIGQVHKATLESGERVVVKVQRPGARDEIM